MYLQYVICLVNVPLIIKLVVFLTDPNSILQFLLSLAKVKFQRTCVPPIKLCNYNILNRDVSIFIYLSCSKILSADQKRPEDPGIPAVWSEEMN